jgi:hypothetical protein
MNHNIKSIKYTKDKIKRIFNEYSKGLFEGSNGLLIGRIRQELRHGKAHFIYRILNSKKTFDTEIFDIEIVGDDGQIKLSAKFVSNQKSSLLTINNLESEIDKIIQSENCGNFMSYLISISS